jgi:hypothetical protein
VLRLVKEKHLRKCLIANNRGFYALCLWLWARNKNN